MASYSLGFWNVENLFDVENSPRRTDKLTRTLAGELDGWTQAVLDRKIERLATVISKMNGDNGPDILGVCEVENRHVLEVLCDALDALPHTYEIVHADTSDNRGIDVAFIYDGDKFSVRPGEIFHHFVVKRTATREIVQVTFRRADDRPLVLIGNHWPSRTAGRFESEPYRIIAAETMAYFHERIYQELGDDTAVIALGDFNDEPFDRSLQHALAVRHRGTVTRGRLKRFLNVMWPYMGTGLGTHYYAGEFGVIDQILVSKPALTGRGGFKVDVGSAGVFVLPVMKSTRTGAPIRHGRPSRSGFEPDGFSDHFPVHATLEDS